MALTVGTVVTTTGSYVSEGAQSFNVTLSAAGNDRILLIWNMSKDGDDPSEAPAYDVILDSAGVNRSYLGGGITRVGAAQLAQEGLYSSASDVFVVQEADLPSAAGTYQIDVRHTAVGSGESVRGLMWAAVEITGAADKVPVVLSEGSDVNNVSAGVWDTHAVTSTVDNSLVFATFGISLGGSTTDTSDPYTGATELVDISLQYGLGHTNYQLVPTAGSITVGQRINTTTDVRHAWHILQIEPASVGGTSINSGTPSGKTKSTFSGVVNARVTINSGIPNSKTVTTFSAVIKVSKNVLAGIISKTKGTFVAKVQADIDTNIVASNSSVKTKSSFAATVVLSGNISINAKGPSAKTIGYFPAVIKLSKNLLAGVDTKVTSNFSASVNAKTTINAAVAVKTITLSAAYVSTGSNTGSVIMSTTLVYSAGAEVNLPFSLGVSKGGGITGLTATVAVRDGATIGSYLDFNDLTFKTSGWVQKNQTLTEVGGGVYTGSVNVAGITNLPANDLVLEYSVNGAVREVAVSSVVFLKRLLEESGALTVPKFLGLKEA